MAIPTFMHNDWSSLDWTPFLPFGLSRREIREIPTGPGVYRIKVAGQDRLAYIGQTGRNLRERLGDLMRHTLADEMPFNDPHTAAPRLWSFRRSEGLDYELSAAAFGGDRPNRLGLECHLLWHYRAEYGASTLCNFGRLAPCYRTSRNRKTGLRGGLVADGPPISQDRSLPPLSLRGLPFSSDWMGLDWSEPEPFCREAIVSSASGPGLYRLMRGDFGVVYLGQTDNLLSRLRSHSLTHRGWAIDSFSVARMTGGPSLAQRLELENDLIGGYYGDFRTVPVFQFRKPERPKTNPSGPGDGEVASIESPPA
jgi:hypothetical protein